ncbi:hypothetical protein OCHUTO_1037 [Orientia chuto str. Dubai]|uniref:Conjugative transfer protein n=1 Tax=Orientia chuto str. Dubai TaxID=1359168 RepID=A0A0F3MHD0_9RICK|nr:hypothetical protein OCHUTO_1037 [Orientia chuto str. Dubai]
MNFIMQQKLSLQQKKAKIIMEELNLKERRMRTRRLIEILVV